MLMLHANCIENLMAMADFLRVNNFDLKDLFIFIDIPIWYMHVRMYVLHKPWITDKPLLGLTWEE